MFFELTSFFVRLLVWPNDGAETGEDQRAQSPSAFLRPGVVVEGIVAQHKPVPTVLYPAATNLP